MFFPSFVHTRCQCLTSRPIQRSSKTVTAFRREPRGCPGPLALATMLTVVHSIASNSRAAKSEVDPIGSFPLKFQQVSFMLIEISLSHLSSFGGWNEDIYNS